MPEFHESREKMHGELVQELAGPKPLGKPLDLTKSVSFATWEESRGPWHDAATGEEILHNNLTPLRRYGVGVLFPAVTLSEKERQQEEVRTAGVPGADAESPDVAAPRPDEKCVEEIRAKLSGRDDDQDDDLDLTLANDRRQSTLGVSVCGSFPADSQLVVTAAFGRYRPIQVTIKDAKQNWWVRSPVTVRAVFPAKALDVRVGRRQEVYPFQPVQIDGGGDLDLQVSAFCRQIKGKQLITLTVTNRSPGQRDAACVFQAGFRATAENGGAFLPYPERRDLRVLDDEEQSIALLYRRHHTFALGHGCAADWEREPSDSVSWVDAVCMPSFEAPSITPDIKLPDGGTLGVDMRVLASPARQVEATEQIQHLLSGYETWILARKDEAEKLPQEYRKAARRHVRDCEIALKRMRYGWDLIKSEPQVTVAFQLANQAMLDQQARSSAAPRETTLDQGAVHVVGKAPSGELPVDRGVWRPFQIAFLLASIESVAHPGSDDRETVELIFFPTGGGKTEAYLAVAAFSMFLRRLRDPEDTGTEVIMRYTLRLLTAQQFLRAAALICAMDIIRQDRADLGTTPYSIGVWLGGSTTPNSQDKAITAWKKLAKDPASAPNQFLLLRCPWCAAKLGPTQEQQKGGKRSDSSIIPGYQMNPRTGVSLACPDRHCPFHKGLPLLVVDTDIYEKPPSMIIGTVDKFAMLAWLPKARAIFGRDSAGRQAKSPPGLIIQDEFHLISGPLGSMVGMYESVIEVLCTDERGAMPVKPKIVSSTATIRRYAEQTRAVYARDTVALFPPPGLEASDSFFSVWARDKDGKLLAGRRYVGVHAPALGSMQSVQVRTAASLLQGAAALSEGERDPWWTGLWFFNSLRELGNSLSLLQSDIPDYLVGLRQREGLTDIRFARTVMELTGRRRNDEIPKAIDELSTPYNSGKAVDVCLSSNIIEVGVDIDRLSLMTIVGQPKTTSQYIQVSGRVGRRWHERPGLVVTLYGAAKPRDRSHYERFRTYHERLYAQVEPTSVTPFALPVMRRALHAALVAYVRLTGPEDLQPWPFPAELAEEASAILRERAAFVDKEEAEAASQRLAEILTEWARWDRSEWKAHANSGDPLNGLMRYAGTPSSGGQDATSWEVPLSMRNVDADCRAAITTSYVRDHASEGAQQ
jgi:hypothetical protein